MGEIVVARLMIDPSPTTPESEIGSQGLKIWNKSPTNMKWQGQPEKGQSEMLESIVDKYTWWIGTLVYRQKK